MLATRLWVTGKMKICEANGTILYEGPMEDQLVEEYSNVFKQSVDTGSFTPGVFRINPYTHEKSSTMGTSGVFTWRNIINVSAGTYAEYSIEGKIGLKAKLTDYPTPVLSDLENRKDLALQKAFSKVGQSQLSLGVELGELKETLEMLRSPLKNLRKWFLGNRGRNATLLGDLRRAISSKEGRYGLVSDVANTWLEIRYGLRPLIMSAMEIAAHVNDKKALIHPDRIRSVGAKIVDRGDSLTRNIIWQQQGDSAYIDLRLSSGAARVIRARVYYRQWLERSSAQELGLSAEYLPEIIWELTRLSFVVDWAFAVGPWLGQFRVKPNIEILGNTCSVRSSITGTATPRYITNGDTFSVMTGSGGGAVLRKEAYDRECDRSLPCLPQFRYADAVSLTHTADALALIWQPVVKRLLKTR